ncbi:Tht1-like nuclear fusion protein, partial [Suhomyces tanzawaensis NRRL Y-17324]
MLLLLLFIQLTIAIKLLDSSVASVCVQKSLQPILPACLSQGIESLDPNLRKILAIKLALCEFQNAGILYPSACNHLDEELELCIENLEKSPQYWTTFSGYYREIQTICYEESLPYQKDHVISLFNNIT